MIPGKKSNPIPRDCAMQRLSLILIACISLTVPGLTACSSNPHYFHAKPSTFDGTGALAVLPLTNLTQYDKAADVVMNALVVELLDSGAFEVVDPGIVEIVVLEKRLRLTDRLPLETIQEIGTHLDVTYLLVGSIHEFVMIRDRTDPLPAVSISLRIVRVADGRIVWASTHSRRGDDTESVFGLGRISTAEQLATAMVKQMIDTLRP
jgi:TolB-like protein